MTDDVRQAAERVRKVRATGLRGGSKYYGFLMDLYHEETLDDAIDAFAEDERILSDAYLAAHPPDDADGWRPIETAGDDARGLFWLDWSDDCAALNGPLPMDSNRIYMGRNRTWCSLYKATHWRLLPDPPKVGEIANPSAVQMIADERHRQIHVEGWTADHDDQHTGGELSWAATAYTQVGSATIRGASAEEFPADMMIGEGMWPGDWDESWWKPSDDPIRNLVKAGALIAAEIDRLLRIKGRKPAKV